jgi:hypothetical protein
LSLAPHPRLAEMAWRRLTRTSSAIRSSRHHEYRRPLLPVARLAVDQHNFRHQTTRAPCRRAPVERDDTCLPVSPWTVSGTTTTRTRWKSSHLQQPARIHDAAPLLSPLSDRWITMIIA